MNPATESNLIFRDAWDAMSHDAPQYEALRTGIIDVSWSGEPTFFLNLAVTIQPPSSLAEFQSAFDATREFAAARPQPWMFAVCHETLGDHLATAQEAIAAAGFVPAMALTGMEATTLTAARTKPAADSSTEADPDIGNSVLRVNEAGYQMTFGSPGTLQMEKPGWWGAPRRMATVLSVDQQPVSSTAVLAVNGLRYVALVATNPNAQRRGYADAAMRDVLERARAAGLDERTYLHATEAGRPVYERMGYTATATYTVYVLAH